MKNWKDDADLLEALRGKDADAFRWLFETYADRIYRLARGLLHSETEADGIVQDTFLRLIERLDQFEGRSTLGTWLYRVAYNLCQDRLRARTPLVAVEEEQDGDLPLPAVFVDWSAEPARLFDRDELQDVMMEAIERLPLKLRAVFMLRDVEGFSNEDCARSLDISPGAAKVRLHRARLQLREHLSETVVEHARRETDRPLER